MSVTQASTRRRVRVERNIYKRPDGTFEVGHKDASGTQRWQSIEGGITAARALRDDLLSRRRRGERAPADPRLRFGEAAERWLAGPVAELRPSTRYGYRNSVERHLAPRYKMRRLDSITPDDVAALISELRSKGMAESSILSVMGAMNRVYRHASRRLGWAGENPVFALLPGERPKPSTADRKRIFEGSELEETIAAAGEPWRTLFTVAALTGARVSELCGLRWADVRVADPEDAEIEFAYQVDRQGNRQPGKTDGSARTLVIPADLARRLVAHNLQSPHHGPEDPVFATKTGRPLSQRNVSRALRAALKKARKANGEPTFPGLQNGGKPERGSLPSMHSFRHTAASRAIRAGKSADEVAWMLGHKDATVTRAVYIREISDAQRRDSQRTWMAEEYGALLTEPEEVAA